MVRPVLKRWWPWALGAAVLVFYYFFDPEAHPGFLRCPFRSLTGLLCPGCGSQRALHDLLHGRLGEALSHNALAVTALPLAILQVGLFRRREDRSRPVPGRLIAGWVVLVVGWGILRNIPGCTGMAH